MTPKKPRPYKGQNPRVEQDEFSGFNPCDPEATGKETESLDALDTDRPAGSSAIAKIGIRWFR